MNIKEDYLYITLMFIGLQILMKWKNSYEEYFYGDGICLIEWADMIEELIPDNAIWINIIKI